MRTEVRTTLVKVSEQIGEKDLHRSHCQDNRNHDFRAITHLEFPDHKPWQNRKCPVDDTADRGVDVRRSNSNTCTHASSISGTGHSRPEEFRRDALEDEQEEEDDAVDFDDPDSGVDCVFVGFFDDETEKHETDAEFDSHVADDVERFAHPPVLAVLVVVILGVGWQRLA